MSRITKAIAEDVARQLVAPKLNELNAIKARLSEESARLYSETLPKDVLALFKKQPKFFNTTKSIKATGTGINGNIQLSFEKGLPTKDNSYYGYINLTDEMASAVVQITNDIETRSSKIRALRNDIETAIFNLRTYNNVEKEFPEAFALLPVSKVNTALAININSIRKEIK